MKTRFIISCFILSLLTLNLRAQVSAGKISPELKNKIAVTENDAVHLVWIYFTDKGDLTLYKSKAYNPVTEKSLQRRMKVTTVGDPLYDFTDLPVNSEYISKLEAVGIVPKHKSKWFNAISAYATAGQLLMVQSFPFVKSLDAVVLLKKSSPMVEEVKGELAKQPENTFLFNYGNSFAQVNQIKVPEVHNLGIIGEGVIVCVMDAGFNRLSHESFNTMNIIAKWDFVNNDPGVGDSSDMGSGSHGTQTLSTIGGFKEGNLIGPAFGATYILAKTENTDSETPIEEDNWIAAAEWADSLGAHVFSTSLGYLGFDSPYPSYTWQSMDGNTARITIGADLAVKKGIVVVNSAGNEGFHSTRNTLGAPSDGDSVIAVGAVGVSGTRSSFSSVGNTIDGRIKPDVMAMGSSVVVASTFSNTVYTTSSGTSFSCPLAAGVAALVLSANPNLTPMQVRDAMRNTASLSTSPNREYGWGILNAFAAIAYFVTPVEGWTMRASVINGMINLEWQTLSEKNNSGFEIEYSSNRSFWISAGFVEGSGTTIYPRSYSYSFAFPNREKMLYIRIKQIDLDGNNRFTPELTIENTTVSIFTVLQNYPNPFNPSTRIVSEIPVKGMLTLDVFNVMGEKVSNLFRGQVLAGSFDVDFTPVNLPSGIYFAKVQFTGVDGTHAIQSVKMTYVR